MGKRRNKTRVPLCPSCGGRKVRFRIKTFDYVCERCGWSGGHPDFIMEAKKSEQGRI